jgi:hypothetical protein
MTPPVATEDVGKKAPAAELRKVGATVKVTEKGGMTFLGYQLRTGTVECQTFQHAELRSLVTTNNDSGEANETEAT